MNLLREHKSRPMAARVTLTHGVTAVSEIFDHLSEMGFDEVGFAPVTSSDDDDYALTPEEFWQVLEEFGELTAKYVAGPRAASGLVSRTLRTCSPTCTKGSSKLTHAARAWVCSE